MFITLEDIAKVWPQVFEKGRRDIRSAAMFAVRKDSAQNNGAHGGSVDR